MDDPERRLTADEAFKWFKHAEDAANTIKNRAWTITTWLLGLNGVLLALGFRSYTDAAGDPGFPILQGAIATAGCVLSLFLVALIRDRYKHLKTYWAMQARIEGWHWTARDLADAARGPASVSARPGPFGERLLLGGFCRPLQLLAVAYLVAFVGMFAVTGWPGGGGASPPSGDEYRRAVADAAVIEAAEVATLRPLEGERLRLVTWSKYPDSFPPGEEVDLDWGELWVTVDGDVRERCARYAEETVAADVHRLLGLPLGDDPREFVTLEVSAAEVFRPCADPDPTATRCGVEFPDDVDAEHRAWFAGQVSASYRDPDGFPWTRLGYTYDWGGPTEVGVQEYVIRREATVRVISREPTASYCSRP